MSNKIKMIGLRSLWQWIAVVVIAIIIFLLIFLFTRNMSKKDLSEPPDLKKHPIYAKYQFSNAPKVIHFGTQPLYMPTGLITETIRRDHIFHQGLLKLGFEIRYLSFLKGGDVNFFMKSNDLDVGIGGDMPFISLAAVSKIRSPIKVQEGFVSIVARRSMLMAQLKSKKIGYAFGSNAHYALLDALHIESIDESDVTLMSIDVNEMSEALYKEQIDVFSAWEPTPAIALKQHPGFVAIHKKLTTGYVYFQQSTYDQHPEAVREICAAVFRAILWMQDEKENLLMAGTWAKQESEKLTGREFLLSNKELATLALKDIIGITTFPRINKESVSINSNLHREFRFLKKIKKIPADCHWNKVSSSFDFQLLTDILAKSEKYNLRLFDYDLRSSN